MNRLEPWESLMRSRAAYGFDSELTVSLSGWEFSALLLEVEALSRTYIGGSPPEGFTLFTPAGSIRFVNRSTP